ncbi:MAG TPA: hypothetical protein VNM72_05525 [Blastocatellia bacterium]|nr:hypothetical protein [Blastocatellia bacterium]
MGSSHSIPRRDCSGAGSARLRRTGASSTRRHFSFRVFQTFHVWLPSRGPLPRPIVLNVARRERILNTPFTNPAVDPRDWRLHLCPGVGRRPQEGSQTCNVWLARDTTTRLEEAQQRWFIPVNPSS